jgi:hypothetical protein
MDLGGTVISGIGEGRVGAADSNTRPTPEITEAL